MKAERKVQIVMSGKSTPSQPNVKVSSLLQTSHPLPEQWTLVKEWHIERRSPSEDWRTLANSHISHMYRQMKESIEQHPDALLH